MIEAGAGAQLVARAEFRLARRRRLALLIPATSVTLWAAADLLVARQHHGAGAFGLLSPLAWTIAVVLVPLCAAIKPRPFRAGSIGAFCAGPILTPAIFGAGGWHPWQIGVLAAVVAVTLHPRFRL